MSCGNNIVSNCFIVLKLKGNYFFFSLGRARVILIMEIIKQFTTFRLPATDSSINRPAKIKSTSRGEIVCSKDRQQ